MEDRSSIASTELTIAGGGGGTVHLTPLAAEVRASGKAHALDWLVRQVSLLKLPEHEFRCTVGLKVKVGWNASVSPLLLPEGIGMADPELGRRRSLAIQEGVRKVTVGIAAYELLVEWFASEHYEGTGLKSERTVAIPVSWTADVLERQDQAEATFRTRIRWLMTELMLARYGLDSYREAK